MAEPTMKKPRLADALELCPLDVTAEAAFLRSSGRKKPPWTPTEQAIVAIKHCELGNRWTQIAAFLPLRSENDVKNIWHSTLRCKDTQKRSFLRTYALAVHDNAYDYAARKAMFDMAVRQCGPPPPQAMEVITRLQGMVDSSELQGLAAPEQEQYAAASAQQHAAAVAAAHATQLQLQQHQAAAVAASGLRPEEQQQLLFLLHQQRQQDARQAVEYHLAQRRQQQAQGSSGDGTDMEEEQEEEQEPPPRRFPPQLQLQLAMQLEQQLQQRQNDAARRQHTGAPAAGVPPADEQEEGKDRGPAGQGEEGGRDAGGGQVALQRRESPPGVDAGTGRRASECGAGDTAGPQLSPAALLQLQQQLAPAKGQGAPPSPSPSASAPLLRHKEERPRDQDSDPRRPPPRPQSNPGARASNTNGSGLAATAVPAASGNGTSATAAAPEALLAHLAVAAAAAGHPDAPAMAALAAPRSPGDTRAQPQPPPSLENILALLARVNPEALPAAARWGLQGSGGDKQDGEEREGLAPTLAGHSARPSGQADWEDQGDRGGEEAVVGFRSRLPPGLQQQLDLQAESFRVKQEPGQTGPAEAADEQQLPAGDRGAAKRARGDSGDGDGEVPLAGARPDARPGGDREVGPPYTLETVNSDELGAVQALALAARMNAQHARLGPAAAGPALGNGVMPGRSWQGAGSGHAAGGDGRAGADEALARGAAGAGRSGAGPAAGPRVSGYGGANLPGPVLDLQPHGPSGAAALPLLLQQYQQQLLPGRLTSAHVPAAAPPFRQHPDALPPRHRSQQQLASPHVPRPVLPPPPPPPQQQRDATALLDIISLLNIPSQRQRVLALPPQGLAALLCSPSFGVDCEASVLLLLADWRAAQAAAGGGVTCEQFRVLCGAIRLAALGGFHLSAVLPHLLTAPSDDPWVAGGGIGGKGPWFQMRSEELAFLLRYVHASEAERAALAEAAAGVYDCTSSWYDMTPRTLSAAAAEGYRFQWHIPLQGLREALRTGVQPHAAFLVGDEDHSNGGIGGGPLASLPCVNCRGLEWHIFIDCQQRPGGGGGGSPAAVAGVFVYCSVPAALRPAPEHGAAGPAAVGVVPGAGIRLGVHGWRCGRMEEVFVWTFGDDTYFVPEAGVGCPAALPLRRRSPAGGVGGDDAAGLWADYMHEGGLRGSLTFLPP